MSKENSKGKVFSTLQKIGKSLMLPVSVLPAAGILLRIGQNDLLGRYGAVFQNLAIAGDAIFENLPLIFAVGVAIGFSGGEAVAALAAVIGQLILQAVLLATGQRYNVSINMGVFGGIIIGLIAAILYNKYHNIKLPQVLGFFGGKRFVPIVTSFASLIFAVIGAAIWQPIQNIINIFARWASTSILGPAFYAAGKRLLIPLGLHHIYYPPFLYQFGEYISNGVKYFGDTARYFHGDPTAGFFMASEFPILMFGLPGAALAIIAAAKSENRKKVSGIMISAAFVAFLTGITEPIEFTFIFVAPILFIFHVLAAFLSGIVTSILKIRLGYTFSASFIDYILGLKFAGRPWLIWLVGIAFFALYFVVFYFVIKTMDIKTPGREDVDSEYFDPNIKEVKGLEKAKRVLMAIGGKENIEVLDACITRLRLTLNEPSKVNKGELKALGAAGVLEAGSNIQVIFGTEAEKIKDGIKSIIENGEDTIILEEDEIEENRKENYKKELVKNIEIINPIEGEIINITEVPDEVFSGKALGDGFAIRPKEGKVVSPIDGEIAVLFPTKHAIAIKGDNDLELLVHIGIDTVNLNGEGFTAHISQGDKVKKGDMLITFDKKVIEDKAKSSITPVVITNMDIVDKMNIDYGKKSQGDKIATVKFK
ncbi:PTS glucose transporter subunit IIA [Clostridium botulinum]|uniref:PTS glucose transporter subunit IIA n=2 Tax=Clostridium botulinum TaxID=1491 RepID=A0A9Q1V150_CLOBO|nr:glucose PTS transporter subunit IIA [Clostridium botulinum]AEB75760.1 PTS enzyme II, ABC component [Clostridium botulinum BKT015925]KEI05783.1 PTS glucose transporter subunit IIA [Clostridium botulinum C/D str. Sp77]KOA76662.1 PTS glucose transporter subunit IIA [Clostridium botulinum]KOA83143.1 PTS glucose transporter subunit IIA [Clostridium botulinum]KOA85322.1 PTS glucose transporter subunit IIA [Clostridium botulinum]